MTTTSSTRQTKDIRYRSASLTTIMSGVLATTHYLSIRTDTQILTYVPTVIAALTLATWLLYPVILTIRQTDKTDTPETTRIITKSWGWSLLAFLFIWVIYGSFLMRVLPLS